MRFLLHRPMRDWTRLLGCFHWDRGRFVLSGSAEDPAVTGWLYGLGAVVDTIPLSALDVDIHPDFTSPGLSIHSHGCVGFRPLFILFWTLKMAMAYGWQAGASPQARRQR